MRQFVLIRRIKKNSLLKDGKADFIQDCSSRDTTITVGFCIGRERLGSTLSTNMGKLDFIAKEQFGGQSMESY